MSVLYEELKRLEGILRQNPETGALKEKESYLGEYTNRLFGAPYQFMDTVDKKFSDVNDYLGNKYLKYIMLNSPIIHIKPGMPYYTGADKGKVEKLKDLIMSLYFGHELSDSSDAGTLLAALAKPTLFGKGSKLQRRMFGFRETYWDYMQHVNYMCRSVAVMLNLISSDTNDRYPHGTFTSTKHGINDEMESFSSMNWQNYRMFSNTYVKDPAEYFLELIGVSVGNMAKSAIYNSVKGFVNVGGKVSFVASMLTNGLTGDVNDAAGNTVSFLQSVTDSIYNKATSGSLADSVANKVSAVEFMIEPGSFQETLTNNTKPSQIAAAINGIGDELGAEIGFITNSNADTGTIGNVLSFLGNGLAEMSTNIAGLVQGVSGGFVTNLFSGAIQSIKGQKMIYPEIYESSQSTASYSFNIDLVSPYGDVYNYYMNIVVPMLHLVALASPRLVTANTTASPYIVQFYIPGQESCHLGIISNMNFNKNPNNDMVSVNGFPLEVRVEVQIKELYNSMAISPGNDPASFLFNETLNDYMANMAGLVPSVDTYVKQRKVAFKNLNLYFSSGEWVNDVVSGSLEKIEDFINPFVGR